MIEITIQFYDSLKSLQFFYYISDDPL